jgi:hypothetical protein
MAIDKFIPPLSSIECPQPPPGNLNIATMDHMAPIAHPAPELDVITEKQMRQDSIANSTTKPAVMEREWGFAARVDPTVTNEEYTYWAKIEREMEMEENKVYQAEHGSPLLTSIRNSFTAEGRKKAKADKEARLQKLATVVEKKPTGQDTSSPEKSDDEVAIDESGLKVSDAEWRNAARALRTASYGQMFFLITTDILGWSGAP